MVKRRRESTISALRRKNSDLKILIIFLLLLNIGQIFYSFYREPSQSITAKYEKIIQKKDAKIRDLKAEIKFNKEQYKKIGLESQYGYGE